METTGVNIRAVYWQLDAVWRQMPLSRTSDILTSALVKLEIQLDHVKWHR